ncbi:MAG: shikimate kinase [Myxococcota bacterium]|nr:shikimate kinase [Myxococcota bacterium]
MPGALWLVGMMGAGKSTLGPIVARALGRPFVDTDEVVVQTAGQSVQAIFESEGERGFRERERAAIVEVAKQGAVVSLGGGAIAQPGAPQRLAALGTVVYLRAGLATLMTRIGDGSQRPMLSGMSPDEREQRIAELLAERAPAYESAQLVVDVDTLEVDSIAEQIASQVRELEAGLARSGDER